VGGLPCGSARARACAAWREACAAVRRSGRHTAEAKAKMAAILDEGQDTKEPPQVAGSSEDARAALKRSAHAQEVQDRVAEILAGTNDSSPTARSSNRSSQNYFGSSNPLLHAGGDEALSKARDAVAWAVNDHVAALQSQEHVAEVMRRAPLKECIDFEDSGPDAAGRLGNHSPSVERYRERTSQPAHVSTASSFGPIAVEGRAAALSHAAEAAARISDSADAAAAAATLELARLRAEREELAATARELSRAEALATEASELRETNARLAQQVEELRKAETQQQQSREKSRSRCREKQKPRSKERRRRSQHSSDSDDERYDGSPSKLEKAHAASNRAEGRAAALQAELQRVEAAQAALLEMARANAKREAFEQERATVRTNAEAERNERALEEQRRIAAEEDRREREHELREASHAIARQQKIRIGDLERELELSKHREEMASAKALSRDAEDDGRLARALERAEMAEGRAAALEFELPRLQACHYDREEELRQEALREFRGRERALEDAQLDIRRHEQVRANLERRLAVESDAAEAALAHAVKRIEELERALRKQTAEASTRERAYAERVVVGWEASSRRSHNDGDTAADAEGAEQAKRIADLERALESRTQEEHAAKVAKAEAIKLQKQKENMVKNEARIKQLENLLRNGSSASEDELEEPAEVSRQGRSKVKVSASIIQARPSSKSKERSLPEGPCSVSFKVSLLDKTVESFGEAAQSFFKGATAKALGVRSLNVVIDSMKAGSVVIETSVIGLPDQKTAASVGHKAADPSILAASLARGGLGKCDISIPIFATNGKPDEEQIELPIELALPRPSSKPKPRHLEIKETQLFLKASEEATSTLNGREQSAAEKEASVQRIAQEKKEARTKKIDEKAARMEAAKVSLEAQQQAKLARISQQQKNRESPVRSLSASRTRQRSMSAADSVGDDDVSSPESVEELKHTMAAALQKSTYLSAATLFNGVTTHLKGDNKVMRLHELAT